MSTKPTPHYIEEINKYRVMLGIEELAHSYNLSGQSKIWAMGLWRGVKPPAHAAVFSGGYGGEDIETGVLSMLEQRKSSGPGGICHPGHDCSGWRVLMDRRATRIGCATLETDRAETIVICATDRDTANNQEAVY